MDLTASKRFALRVLRPHTKKGKVVLWAGATALLCRILFDLTGHMRGWGIFATIIFLPPALWMFVGWCRRRALWRLRHRLIVTYIFIGVIPVLLLLTMAALSGYVLAGQFATYVASSHLQSELHRLEASNSALAEQLHALDSVGKLSDAVAKDLANVSGASFAQSSISIWRGDKAAVLLAAPTAGAPQPIKVPDFIPADFSHFVVDADGLSARAVKRYAGPHPLTIISSMPVTKEVLRSAGASLGSITVNPPGWDGDTENLNPTGAAPAHKTTIKSGQLPRSAGTFDLPVGFLTFLDIIKWNTGKSSTGTITVVTRPSALYDTLFSALGDKAVFMERIMLALAIFFGFIELVALIIGLFLSRSITVAVAKLYNATQHVNNGDLTHRIKVHGRDQMAALEQSFNNMTDSLVLLVAEQKEKQRLESELAIAQQVQDLLFPHKSKEFSALEVYGFCRPARSVSGDYYDFIPTGADSLMLAVGDISGKGVSAALLMATVHAFVRAYSLEPGNVRDSKSPHTGPIYDGDHSMYYRGGGGADSAELAPGMLMTTLNYQLFHCTPPEKYATMFLGCYDAAAQELTYCNAGHLPPMMVRADGTVFRLGVSGTVVGLFDGATYEKSSIGMQSGDLFVAFSDGVTEPENDRGEFGEDRLIALLREHRHQPLPRISEIVVDAVTAWIGHAEQPDDVTVVLARAR